MDDFPGSSGDRICEWENVILGGTTRDICHDRMQAQGFLEKFVITRCEGAAALIGGRGSYLHNRTHVRHGVEIVGCEFCFSSSLDLPPGFEDFFSKPGLDLWIFRELVQTPRDLFFNRLSASTNGNVDHFSLTVMAVVSWAANMIVLNGGMVVDFSCFEKRRRRGGPTSFVE